MTRWLSIILLITVCACPVPAQDVSDVTLQRIADKGIFTIGYVPDAAPMSFNAPDGKVSGYSMLREFGVANEYNFRLRLIETHDEGMRLLNAGEVDG